MSEDMSERMPEIMSAKDVRRYGIRYVRKECQKGCQNRLSERDVRRYVGKGCQKICQKRMSEDTPEEMSQRTSLLNGLY